MAYKTVANLRDSVSGILQGLNLNNVTNLYTAFERTARNLAQYISIPSAFGRTNITLYDGITDYVAENNILGTSVIDLQPQGNTRYLTDFLYKYGAQDFDRTKSYVTNGSQITFDSRNGTEVIRIKSVYPIPRIVLDPMTATTGWTAAGSASGLTQDETLFYQPSASLRFTLTGSSTGTLTKSISSVDLTSYVGVGVVFLAFRTPSATDLTSMTVKIGSSASDYYSVSATTGFLGAWTTGDWMIAAFDLSQATTTGTPTVTAIDYAQISFVHTATLTNFYVGDFWISLPYPSTLIYATTAIFKAASSNPASTITDNNDSIILSDDAYAIFEQECAKTVAKQQGGKISQGSLDNINEDLYGQPGNPNKPGLYSIYRANNPSQIQVQTGSYYD